MLEYFVLLHQNKEEDGSHLALGGMRVYVCAHLKGGIILGWGVSLVLPFFLFILLLFFFLILEYGVGFLI